MSAWIVSRAHIDVLVQALTAEAGLTPGTPDEIGRELWRENLRSVAYRYPRDTEGTRPGPIEFKDSDVDTYTYREPSKVIPDGGIVAAARCYDYQSCEHPEWDASRAAKWMETLVSRHQTAVTLDKFPWGYDEEDVHVPGAIREGGTYESKRVQTNADLWR